MSYDAIRWAWEQPVKPAMRKLVLLAMADCVNAESEEMVCWPSYAFVALRTGMNTRTVETSVYELKTEGYLVDTGRRAGTTGKVVVYRLNTPKTGGIETRPQTSDANGTRPQNTPEKWGICPTMEASEIPPNPTANPPKNDGQSPQKLQPIPPKTGVGTKKEPGRNQEGTRKRGGGFDAAVIDLPDWIERDDWLRWCKDRKTRGIRITEDAARLQLKKLADYRNDGFTAAEVIDNSIANGYQGLYPPKRAAAKPKSAGRHAGFRELDYSEGTTNGIPDA